MGFIEVTLEKVQHLEGQPMGDGSGGPIVTGYSLKGLLQEPPYIGKTLVILRTERNGVVVPGVFESSTIKNVTNLNCLNKKHKYLVYTQNSVYRVEEV